MPKHKLLQPQQALNSFDIEISDKSEDEPIFKDKLERERDRYSE